jgi:hypothetical protein
MYEQSKSQEFLGMLFERRSGVELGGFRRQWQSFYGERYHARFPKATYYVRSIFPENKSRTAKRDEKLVHLLSRCVRSTIMNEIEVKNGTAAPIYHPGIPDSKGSFRHLYRDGIISNLLCPEIHSKNGHAFVKLREVIAHHFGHGKEGDFLGAYTNENESVPATVRSLAELKQAAQIVRAA